jgi:hypothetical protein
MCGSSKVKRDGGDSAWAAVKVAANTIKAE